MIAREPEQSLAVDLHCHLERDEDVPTLAELIAEDLDVLAITNHANKRGVMRMQGERISELARMRPDLVLVYGMEWNVWGTHVNVLFPSANPDEGLVGEFLDCHEPCDDQAALQDSLSFLGSLPESQRPILCLNHPAHPDPGKTLQLAASLLDCASPLTIAVDGFHGHQGWKQLHEDPFDYPGSCIDGLCDVLYRRSLTSPLLAGSDFHPNKQQAKPDYPPGVYQRVIARGAGRDVEGLFAALRRGRTYVVQNNIVSDLEWNWKQVNASSIEVSIEIETLRPLERFEVLVGTERGVHVAWSGSIEKTGRQDLRRTLAASEPLYLRLRGSSTGPCGCNPDRERIAGFVTSASLEDFEP